MASPHDCRVRRPCRHSHTHHHSEAQSNTRLHHCLHCPLHLHCRHCPLHSHRFRNNFQPLPPPYVAPLPQNLHHFGPLPLPSSGAVQYKEASASDSQISQELQHVELDDEDEDDEPIFVLTDEWREFFAKSEARRKQEKKGGRK